MGFFTNKTLTADGMDIMASGLNGGTITFTKIALGSGAVNNTDLTTITELAEVKNILNITNISRVGAKVILTATLRSDEIVVPYNWSEIGVFAKVDDGEEKLYLYGTSTEPHIISAEALDEKIIEISVICGNTANVTAVIDNSLIFATKSELEEVKEDVTVNSAAIEELGNRINSTTISSISSDKVTAMTGYGKGDSSDPISTSDSLNTAIGKLEYGKVDREVERIAIGSEAIAVEVGTIAIGVKTKTGGIDAIAIGYGSNASEQKAIAIGTDDTNGEGNALASALAAIAIGVRTKASGISSTAIGAHATSNEERTIAIGNSTTANGRYSIAIGRQAVSSYQGEIALGNYNKTVSNVTSSTGNLLTIGNGTGSSSRSNAFRITWGGTVYSTGSYNTSGADYGEYFEWLDQNPNNEDRIGYFVTLEGNKIRKATAEDDYILGVISGTASIVGNAASEDWNGKYERDEWGRIQFEDVTIPAEYETIINENGEEEQILIEEEHTVNTMKISREYNENKAREYLPRSERKEWDVVGMFGQILVRDDGTGEVNGYVDCGTDGIATSGSRYRVLERVADNIIKILFR